MYKVDSRKVKQGDTFVALRGISSDGHDYIETAIKNGATKIICEEGNYSVETIIVKDSRKYLEELLKTEYKDELSKVKLIGVTGTNGKTTTAYLIYELLNMTGNKCAYIGSIGYYLDKKVCDVSNTSPDLCELYNLILNSIENGCKYVVMEASSQGLSYRRLEGLHFECAIYTNLTLDHLDYHKTMENYALAKQLLFKQTNCAIVNSDDEYKDYYLLKENKNITYGYNGDYKLISFVNNVLKYNEKEIKFNVDGIFNAYNLLASIACLDHLKIKDYEKYISKLVLPSGRVEKIKYKNNIIIVDSAHDPDACLKIVTLGKSLGKKLITVFGCRGNRYEGRRALMGQYTSDLSDKVILTKDNPNDEDLNQINKQVIAGMRKNNYEIINDRLLAIKKGISYLDDNDVLLILGKGPETCIVEKGQKYPFNDTEVVKKCIEEIEVNN